MRFLFCILGCLEIVFFYRINCDVAIEVDIDDALHVTCSSNCSDDNTTNLLSNITEQFENETQIEVGVQRPGIADPLTIMYNISINLENYTHHLVTISRGDSVMRNLAEICSIIQTDCASNGNCRLSRQLNCESVCDQISFDLYHNNYTPTRENSTSADFIASRATVLIHLANRFGYRRYLEIGTHSDLIFNVMRPLFDYSVGVDPALGGTHRMTSDEFFASNTDHFDLIFIDGLHEANQVFRDVINSLKWLSPNGSIVLHDCNPRGDPIRASWPRDPKAASWNGDTWKATVALRLRYDLDVIVVDIDHGVGVLRRRPNTQRLSPFWLEKLTVSPISMLNSNILWQHRNELLRLKSLSEFQEWLDSEEVDDGDVGVLESKDVAPDPSSEGTGDTTGGSSIQPLRELFKEYIKNGNIL